MSTVSCKIDRRAIEKFTKEQRAVGSRITLADTVCAGLKLVINSNSASWTYTYRKRGLLDGGKRHPQRSMKLGDPVSMTPAEARLAADQVKAQVRAGYDPAIAQRREKAERRAEIARRKTCVEWAKRYEVEQLSGGQTKHQRDEGRNVRFALEEIGLGDRFPEEITAKHIRALIESHVERPATSRQRFGALSRFLDYLLDEEVIDINPAGAISKRARPKPAPPRNNYFTPEQIGLLWNAGNLNPEYQRYLRFMITTPLRQMEGAELRWDQVHEGQGELRLQASDTKNSEYFVMPLTSLAAGLIGEPGHGDLSKVFQLTRLDDGRMTAWSHFTGLVRHASGVTSFSAHDLRRTFSTLMAEHSDVPLEIVDGLLNHKQSVTRGGVLRHYQHAKQLAKRREAMQVWERMLEGWI